MGCEFFVCLINWQSSICPSLHYLDLSPPLIQLLTLYGSQVVHVVDTTRSIEDPRSYVSLFSSTPGKLTKEVKQIKEGFRCGRDQVFDFVTFTVKYGCWTEDDSDSGWSEADIPVMHVQSDTQGIERTTEVLIDTKGSIRWALAINTNEIRDFAFTGTDNLISAQCFSLFLFL